MMWWRTRRFIATYRLLREHRSCQMPTVAQQAGQIVSECSGTLLVMPKRPFAPPSQHGTVLCYRHWRWVLEHIDQAAQLDLLDSDWFTDPHPHR